MFGKKLLFVFLIFLMVMTSACMNLKGKESGSGSSETSVSGSSNNLEDGVFSGEVIQQPDYVSYEALLSLLGQTRKNEENGRFTNNPDGNEIEKISDLASCVIDIGKFGFPRLIDKADLLNQEEKQRFYDQIDASFSQLERLDSGFKITATVNPEIASDFKDKAVRLSVYDADGNVVAVSEYRKIEKETLVFSPLGFSDFLRGVFFTITVFEKETALDWVRTGRAYKPIKALLFLDEDKLLLY